MDLLELARVYVRVVELASFSRAAENLGMAKASVSAAVQRLETQLQARLLQRTTRRVQPTPDGLAFYERCRELLAEADDMRGMFRRGEAALSGRLRVDMSSGMARCHVIPALPQFLAAHPGLELELSSSDRRIDPIAEGVDCVVRVGPVGDVNLIARRLGCYRVINVASPEYLARHGTPRSLADLAAHRMVSYAPGFGAAAQGWEYPVVGGYACLKMPVSIAVNSVEAYEAACLAGLGLVQVPAPGAAPNLAAGRLVEVLPELRPEPMPVTLLYPQRRHLPERVQVFMAWLAGILAPLLD